jgi:hypothetical protein
VSVANDAFNSVHGERLIHHTIGTRSSAPCMSSGVPNAVITEVLALVSAASACATITVAPAIDAPRPS